MALTLTPSPYQTVLSSTGVAVSGAKITTYLAGTTTAASTYTTSVGDVANANPIIADSAGRFVAYLSAGASYKFVITDSDDVAIDTQDNILSVPGSSVNLDTTATAGEAIAAGEVAYIAKVGDAAGTPGLWYLTDADNAYSSSEATEIGIAVSAIAINTSGTIRLAGEVSTAGAVVLGTVYYASATAGELTSSSPTNTRTVGIAQSTSTLLLNANTAVTGIPSPITQDLLFTDNTYDIGKSGATRPRDLFQSRNAVIGGTLAVTGATTLTGGLNTPLVVAQGGTGLATLTSANVIIGAGTGTPTFVAPSTSGNVLTSNGSAWTSAASSTPESDLAICEGRLTLTSGTAVTTADVTGATSIYFAPYKGSRIALYDGSSAWNIRTFTEITIALGTLTDAKPYDLFAYDNSGTVTFDSPLVWTNSTTRATALALQNGVLVKTGATTRRYIGTFYTTAATTTEDSFAKRLLFNYAQRVERPMQVLETTDNWAYTSSTIRQANGSTANQLAFVVGVVEDAITASVQVVASSGTAGQSIFAGVGLDSTSAFASATRLWHKTAVAGYQSGLGGQYCGYPGLGYHFLSWLERGNDSGTTTWIGDDGAATTAQGGIQGMIRG
jgi:hypothetical protein